MWKDLLVLILNVGLLDGLLGVAGMIIVDLWIIPENSLRLARTTKKMWNPKMLIHYSEISFLGGFIQWELI